MIERTNVRSWLVCQRASKLLIRLASLDYRILKIYFSEKFSKKGIVFHEGHDFLQILLLETQLKISSYLVKMSF